MYIECLFIQVKRKYQPLQYLGKTRVMAYLTQRELQQFAIQIPLKESVNNLSVAKSMGRKTAFLSHSHKDKELALGLKNKLKQQNVEVYIDWEDEGMPDRPNQITAQQIKNKIFECHIFMFLVTQNSVVSRWCPWEIGFADGKKSYNQILVVPTIDDRGTYYGNEYLQIYYRLELPDNIANLSIFAPGQNRGSLFEDFVKIA